MVAEPLHWVSAQLACPGPTSGDGGHGNASGACGAEPPLRREGTDGRPEDRRWYMEGKIDIDDLITHTMPLDEINTAFDLMHEGKSIRSVVVY
jgi:hypothetical protein